MKISNKDITFVVCGLVSTNQKNPFTAVNALKSIRKYFPESPIVLSTWDEESTEELEGLYDCLVKNSPSKVKNGLVRCSLNPDNLKMNSINLQAFSVHQGLLKVKTKYAVRFRTDFYLQNRNFIDNYVKWHEVFSQSNPDYTVFHDKVMIPKTFTRNPEKTKGYYAFETSDFFAFGLTEDLLLRWNGRQEDLSTLAYFSDKHEHNPYNTNQQYSTEQYGLLNILALKKPSIALPKSYCDVSRPDFTTNTHKFFISNYFIGSFADLGLASRFKRKEKKSKKFFELYRYADLYRQEFKIRDKRLSKIYFAERTKYFLRICFKIFL